MTEPSLTGPRETMHGMSFTGPARSITGPSRPPAESTFDTPSPGPGVIRLGRMLLHRELHIGIVFDLLISAAVGVGAARLAAAATEATVPGLVMTILQNFNAAVALALAVLLILRVAVRDSDDRRDGWLEPLIAAGVPRWHFGLALPAAALLRATLAFATAAVAFAIGHRLFASSTELVVALPRTLGAGLLFLASFAACAAPIAFALRNVGATVALTLAVTVVPLLLAALYLYSGTMPPPWLPIVLGLTPARPPPPDVASGVYGVAYVIVGMALAAAAAHRFAGRRP